jgi:hypothetical protein
MAEHREEFQRELAGIEVKVIELFAMVAEDLPVAADALLAGSNEHVQARAEREQVLPGRNRLCGSAPGGTGLTVWAQRLDG